MKPLAIIFAVLAPVVLTAQTPTFTAGSVVNGASFQNGAIAPGSLISIFGTALSTKLQEASSIPLSTSLGGVTVTFQSNSQTIRAPLLYVQPDNASKSVSSQVNAQVPWEFVQGTTVNVIVNNGNATSAPAQLTVGQSQPGIFSASGRAIAVNANGTLAWPSSSLPNGQAAPAKIGSTIIVYATGLGPVDHPIKDGDNSIDTLRRTISQPLVMIGGLSAQVPFSGLSPQFVGVNQLNVTIPNVTPGDAVPIQIQMNGITTSNQITIAVSQ